MPENPFETGGDAYAQHRPTYPDGLVDLLRGPQTEHALDVALVTYGVPELQGPAATRFASFYWHDVHPFWPAARAHVEQGYRSVPFPFPELDFAGDEIVREWNWEQLEGYIRTWSATRNALRAGEEDRIQGALAEHRGQWGPDDAVHQVRWPFAARRGRVHPEP